jgi:hypothetical protein
MRRGLTLGGALLSSLLMLSGASAQETKGLSPGVLSLDSSVGVLDKAIEDGKSSIEKALGISISGFLDTSYTYSTNYPRSLSNISGRYFDKDHNKVVFNTFNLTLEKPEKDWGVGFKVVGDFGRMAELLREATFWSDRLGDEPSAELREAFVTTTIPIGEGLAIKGGLFVTPLGTEIIPAPNAYNDNISRSFAFNFGVPLRHLGVLLSYPLLKVLTISAGPVTGWDNPHDQNDGVSFLGGVAFTPMDSFALASNVVYGAEQRDRSGPKRFAWSSVATIKPFDPLVVYLEYVYGFEEFKAAKDGSWHGLAAIGSYGWTDRFSTALRGEVFFDNNGSRTAFGRDVDLGEITLTAAYKFTSKLLGRVEVRQDWSDKAFYQRGRTRADENQTTFALQAIYTF